MNNNPLVSICIPVFNGEDTIDETLQSIINQTYKNLEIIISDNASTDRTLEYISRYNDPRIFVHTSTVNSGNGETNWNKCIKLAHGEYIAIFHADDVYEPTIVEKQLKVFLLNPSVGAVFTMGNHINVNSEVIGQHKLPKELHGKEIYFPKEIFISVLKHWNFLLCPSVMVKGSIYREFAPFDLMHFRTSSDLDMWLRISDKYPVAILEERLMNYRFSEKQGSHQYRSLLTDEANLFKVLDYHLSLQSETTDIPQNVLEYYEFQRGHNKISRAVNYVILDQENEAKSLLRESSSTLTLGVARECIRNPVLFGYWFSGQLLLLSLYLGLGSPAAKCLNWLLQKYGLKLYHKVS